MASAPTTRFPDAQETPHGAHTHTYVSNYLEWRQRTHATHAAGEVAEYKQDLNSTDKSKQKDALKKVIAAMTVGKDVSMLFADVTRCMQTDDLELKKLVYLYLINYAKSQPEMAILAVNTFVKVCSFALLTTLQPGALLWTSLSPLSCCRTQWTPTP